MNLIDLFLCEFFAPLRDKFFRYPWEQLQNKQPFTRQKKDRITGCSGFTGLKFYESN